MAYATDIRTEGRIAGLLARFTELRTALTERWATARVYRTTLRELQSLSPRDLADLGIAPGSLRAIAYEAAYGK